MTFFSIVRAIASFIWGPQMLIFILGSGIYSSIRLKAIQFRKFKAALQASASSYRPSGEGSSAEGVKY